jgi:hypothetical protein
MISSVGSAMAIPNESRIGVAGAPLLGFGKFLYAYGTQANVNRVGLLYSLVLINWQEIS